MNYHVQLQPRDELTLDPLVHEYRLTRAEEEAERHGISVSVATRRLNRLTAGRLLNRLTAWVSQVPSIDEPLFEWNRSDPTPDFDALSYQCCSRWHNRPIRKCTIYTASKKLLLLHGLPPRSPLKKVQATHDLGVQYMSRFCKERFPDLQFIGEEMFACERGHGEAVEDGQLRDANGNIVYVAEYTGAYRASRLQHLHEEIGLERNTDYLLF